MDQLDKLTDKWVKEAGAISEQGEVTLVELERAKTLLECSIEVAEFQRAMLSC